MAASTPMTLPGRAEVTPQQIQKLLDENAQIIKTIVEIQNVKGKSMDCLQYQQTLHRNLIYLAGLADPRLDLQTLLPPPGSNLFQSQRALPSQPSPSSQSMTPPPSSMTSTGSNNMAGIVRRPPHAGTSIAGGMSSSTQPSTMAHWGGPSMRQQTPVPGQYQMKGYAPGPWLQQGGPPPPPPPGPYGMSNQAQVRLQMEEQQRRQMLRMHQEQVLQQQQARRMQQQAMQGTPPPSQGQMGGMYPPPPQGVSGASYMTAQPPMSGAYSQPNAIHPHSMPQMDM